MSSAVPLRSSLCYSTGMDEKDWVAERAKCHMGKLFADVRKLIERDIGRWNTIVLHDTELHGGMIILGDRSLSFVIEHTAIAQPEQLGVGYIPSEHCVRVNRGEQLQTITTRWDRETSQCRIVVTTHPDEVTEFPHSELEKVVQYILEPFFFTA